MSNLKSLLEQRAELEKQIEKAQKEEKSAAISQVRQLVSDYGLTPSDCGFGASNAAKAKKSVAAKYRAPSGETWTGRGKAPRWITEHEQSGKSRNDFLI